MRPSLFAIIAALAVTIAFAGPAKADSTDDMQRLIKTTAADACVPIADPIVRMGCGAKYGSALIALANAGLKVSLWQLDRLKTPSAPPPLDMKEIYAESLQKFEEAMTAYPPPKKQ